jgi:hypothetical protein
MLENTNDKHKTGNHFMSRSCFRQKPSDHFGIMVGDDDNMHRADVCQEKIFRWDKECSAANNMV